MTSLSVESKCHLSRGESCIRCLSKAALQTLAAVGTHSLCGQENESTGLRKVMEVRSALANAARPAARRIEVSAVRCSCSGDAPAPAACVLEFTDYLGVRTSG